MNLNWVDFIILLVLVYYAIEGARHGLFIIIADFISFLVSLLVSLRFYKLVAIFLRDNFNLSHSISNAVGFLLTAILAEAVLGFLLAHFIGKIPKKYWQGKWNKFAAVIPSIGEGLVIIAFILTLVMSLPLKPGFKKDVVDSRFGGIILERTTRAEKYINEIFGGVIEDSLTYLTVKPDSRESVPLKIDVGTLAPDSDTEAGMFELVNMERAKVGVTALEWSPDAVPVARKHAEDMWRRKYFSHYSPEGDDVGDRLNSAKVKYSFAGENLALAPTLQTAHTGLMNSEGHKENILEMNFRKVGIGVIDNGVYGKMFVQVFTD